MLHLSCSQQIVEQRVGRFPQIGMHAPLALGVLIKSRPEQNDAETTAKYEFPVPSKTTNIGPQGVKDVASAALSEIRVGERRVKCSAN